MNPRTFSKMRREAWRTLDPIQKDDAECCFALGFSRGVEVAQAYDAVALRAEPPLPESGGGFESHPASRLDLAAPEVLLALRRMVAHYPSIPEGVLAAAVAAIDLADGTQQCHM